MFCTFCSKAYADNRFKLCPSCKRSYSQLPTQSLPVAPLQPVVTAWREEAEGFSIGSSDTFTFVSDMLTGDGGLSDVSMGDGGEFGGGGSSEGW